MVTLNVLCLLIHLSGSHFLVHFLGMVHKCLSIHGLEPVTLVEKEVIG